METGPSTGWVGGERAGLVIASNRLPFTLGLEGETLTVEPSSGGLVSALRGSGRGSVC